MPNKIYVGNLPISITDRYLLDLFSQIGKVVSAYVVVGIDGKRNSGYGYVIMSNDKETQDAISKLNNRKLEGNSIKVVEAHPIDQDRSYLFRRYRTKRR